MKKTRFCALLLFLTLSSSVSVFADGAVDKAVSKHCLWEVQGKSNVVYLVGSIHLLKAEDYPLAAPIESAFTNSRVAAFETDISQMEGLEAMQQILTKAQLPDGATLEKELTPETYRELTNHVFHAGIPLFLIQSLKPVMAVAMIEQMELMKLGADPKNGLDEYFFARARESGKRIVPLETLEFQIGLVTDFTKAEGELLVKSTLKEIDNTRQFYADMVSAWKIGDAAKLEKLLNDAMQDSPAIYKRLVTNRNQSWVPQIEELLRGNQNAIVIVGAGHLVGAEGVVELLRKKRFPVTQR
jgi:uncharacterized protein YbaP (TraB family)